MNESISPVVKDWLSTIGSRGGSVSGGRKAAASQANGRKGGRKKVIKTVLVSNECGESANKSSTQLP